MSGTEPKDAFYYSFLYKQPMLTFVLPFLLATAIFFLMLLLVARKVRGRNYVTSIENRLRAPKVLNFLSKLL